MTPRTILAHANWTLSPTDEGTPRMTMTVLCTAPDCGRSSSPVVDETAPLEMWAIKHTGLNPTHRAYTFRVDIGWQVQPAEGNPHRGRP
ncbi:hypothetical protein GCM10027168_17900 [Streptomyces capparidis]